MPRSAFPGAEKFLPDELAPDQLAKAAEQCRGCDLYRNATQTVFGAGAERPTLVLVGEQPGDVEDREGEPFVGPAGRLLDKALAAAGIDPATTYRTNAVKHFRFERVGKRRIHKKPTQSQVTACRPWLLAEFSALRPDGVVLLGATAAQALLGAKFRVSEQRGVLLDYPGDEADWVLATAHPSAVLRTEDRAGAFAALVADLRVAAEALENGAPDGG